MGKAVDILDEMLLAGINPNEHTYTTIMNGYASLGDIGKAFEYFSKLKNEGLELDVYTYEALLKACCKSGRMQSALAVTKEMKTQNIPRNTFIYNILIDGYGVSYTWIPLLALLLSYIQWQGLSTLIYISNIFFNADGLAEVMFGRLQI